MVHTSPQYQQGVHVTASTLIPRNVGPAWRFSPRLALGLIVLLAIALVSGCTGSGREVGNQEGDLAPDFTVTSVDGETVTRDALLNKERPFILYFFATW